MRDLEACMEDFPGFFQVPAAQPANTGFGPNEMDAPQVNAGHQGQVQDMLQMIMQERLRRRRQRGVRHGGRRG